MTRVDRQMAKVTHGVSAILHPLHIIEEEVMQTPEIPVTPDDNKATRTSVMFKDIMTKALKEQKSMAGVTSAEAVKVAYTDGVNKDSELQMHPLHSSTIEHYVMCYPVEHSPIMPLTESRLHPVHLLRPGINNVMGQRNYHTTLITTEDWKVTKLFR